MGDDLKGDVGGRWGGEQGGSATRKEPRRTDCITRRRRRSLFGWNSSDARLVVDLKTILGG